MESFESGSTGHTAPPQKQHPMFSKFAFPRPKQGSNLSAALSGRLQLDTKESALTPGSGTSLVGADPHPDDHTDTDSDTDTDTDTFPKSEESVDDYRQGGYHPTFVGEHYGARGQYRVVRKLGWGHFSTVWLCWDDEAHRHVAIKIVRSSSNYREAALDEIKILERVNAGGVEPHPGKHHIVELLDHFIHRGPNGDHVCMVFEVLGENMLNLLVRFKDFKDQRRSEIEACLDTKHEARPKVITESMKSTNLADLQILSNSYGGLPLGLVKQITRQMLLALDYLHRVCGIIHTDLKPENVLVEISDVERLVKLLELERKNKKMLRVLERRKAGKSVSENSRPANIPIPRRKSSVVRSKPLTSPLEKSSVDNFFRSFSFSQRPTMQPSSTSSSLGSRRSTRAVSYAKTASLEECEEEEEDREELAKNTTDSHNHANGHANGHSSGLPPGSVGFPQGDPLAHILSQPPVGCRLSSTATNDDTDVGSTTEGDEVFVDACEDVKRRESEVSQISELSHVSHLSRASRSSNSSILNDFDSIITIKIADLGNACWYNKHYTEDIQTRQYRAPEVILGGDWGCSTDLWSLSCLVFELVTGDYLFDPRSTKSYTRDEDHLAQMVELLEEWPPVEYLQETSRWSEYFDHSCTRFRRISKLKMWSLEKVLKEEYGMPVEEAADLGRFLRCGLQYRPADRIDAGSLASHGWVREDEGEAESHTGPNGPTGHPVHMGDGSLDRPFGLRGPDIRGWASLSN